MQGFKGLIVFFALITVAQAAQIGEDSLVLGKKGSVANKTVSMGSGRVVWNQSTSKLTFSNDAGSSFKNFGSGGGSGGINLLADFNFDFEGGTAGWTASGGSFTTASAGSNLMFDALSGVFNSSATGQFLSSTNVPISEGFKNNNGAAGCFFKTTASDYKLQVYDGTNVVAERVITPTTVPTKQALTFVYPSSGNVRLRIASQSDASDLAIDNCFLGENSLIQVSQSSLFGSISTNNDCSGNFGTASTSYASLGTVTSCTYAVTANALPPATMLAGINFQSLPPGDYIIDFIGQAFQPTQAKTAQYILTDGTQVSKEEPGIYTLTGGQVNMPVLTFSMHYTGPQSNITFEIRGKTDSGGQASLAGNYTMRVTRLPGQAELAVRPETLNWIVDASIAGSNIDLGTTTQGLNTPIGDPSLSLTPASGSASVQIGCTGTNPPTGSTCSAGTPELAWAFNVPVAGRVKACVDATHLVQTTNGSVEEAFQLVETALANDATILQSPTTSLGSGVDQGVSRNFSHPLAICGIFNFTSSGTKMIRLVHQSSISGTIAANLMRADSSLQNRSVSFHASPMTQSIPAPILIGSVISPSQGVENVTRANIDGGGGVNCTSSPCTVESQNGSWITSVTRAATGSYTLHTSVGTFSATPICVCNALESGVGLQLCLANLNNPSTLDISVQNGSAAYVDATFNVICMGPK